MSTFPNYSGPDAGGISNLTALQGILKEYYGPQQVKVMVYRRNKLFAMVHKEEDWAGEVVPIPVIIGNPQGAGRNFARALATVSASTVKKFMMEWTQDYQVVTVTNLVQLASRNDAGAFLKAVQREMNGGLKNSENRWAGSLFRSSTGSIGSGTINTGVITLSDPAAITQFENGMVLEASTIDGDPALGAPSYGYVIKVNRDASTVTVSTTATGTAGTPASWTGTMFFRTGGDANLALSGLADFIPTTAPTSGDNFKGVDRSVDPSRLAGIRWNGANTSIEEAVVGAAGRVAREDGNPELGITNHTSFVAFEYALGAKREYVNYEHDDVPGVGFKGLRIHGADEEINIFADRSCPGKLMYLLDPDSMTLGSMKALPHILTELDGLTELRDPNNDATQIRIGGYAIFAIDAPGHNAVVTLSS